MDKPTSGPQLIAQKALEYIQDGDVIGIGTGRAAVNFIHALAERVKAGLDIRGIPTSDASAQLAKDLGIPLTTFAVTTVIDVAIDGADEVDPQGNLIKGLGGALIREKIVASAAKKFIVLVGKEKLVDWLGSRGVLPVEVVPFGMQLCAKRINDLGYATQVRCKEGQVFLSDNGNNVLDCHIEPIADPIHLERTLVKLPGVVGTGLFLGMADAILIDHGDHVEVRTPKS